MAIIRLKSQLNLKFLDPVQPTGILIFFLPSSVRIGFGHYAISLDSSALMWLAVVTGLGWWKTTSQSPQYVCVFTSVNPIAQEWNFNKGYADLFGPFKGGPDWVDELALAEKNLYTWAQDCRQQYQRYHKRLMIWKKKFGNHSALPIDHYFMWVSMILAWPNTHKQPYLCSRTSDHTIQTPLKGVNAPCPRPPGISIISDMCRNKFGCFCGLGRHTANDILYLLGIFPGTPSYIICRDQDIFKALRLKLKEYMLQFTTDPFLKRTACACNHDNPFSFNESNNSNYISTYIHVFRRTSVLVPHDLYNQYMKQGLLDKNHTIGEREAYFYLLRVTIDCRWPRRTAISRRKMEVVEDRQVG